MSYVADTFASCLTHPFPSEGDIACEIDSSNLYVNPLDGSGGGGSEGSAGATSAGAGGGVSDYSGVRKSASGDGSVLCGKGSQGEVEHGSRVSLAGADATSAILPATQVRALDASRSSLPQTLEDAYPFPPTADEARPKHRKARFQQVSFLPARIDQMLP